jgi:uncharacterized protein YneF (UPF0154 family)
MTAGTLWTVVVIAILVALVAGGYFTSRRRSKGVIPGEPDRVSADVVSGLMAELRKAQAESTYWKSTAERLQREADER